MKTYNNNSAEKFFPFHYIPQDSHGARKTLLLRQYFDNSCQKQFKETKLETKEPPKKKKKRSALMTCINMREARISWYTDKAYKLQGIRDTGYPN